MDKRMLYTSLGRTIKLEYLHFDFKKLKNCYFNKNLPNLEYVNSRFNSLHKNGRIYEVVFNNDRRHVGSTCENLEVRLSQHIKDKTSSVYKYRNNNPKIKLIVNAPSKDKKNLEKGEKKHIEEYADKFGSLLINKRSVPEVKKKKKRKKNTISNRY